MSGFSLFKLEDLLQKDFKIIVLGCGLCALSKFIYNYFENIAFTNIDISKNVLECAKNIFEI